MMPPRPPAYVYIDNSNIYGGAMRAGKTVEKVPWQAVRVYWPNLFKLIEGPRIISGKVLAGSVPPSNMKLWEYARKAGYKTELLKRVEADDGRLLEQGVDEALHLKIANALLDHEPPQTLVLVTGDGQASEQGTSFVDQAERAARRGWDVEVWSWKAGLSGQFARTKAYANGRLAIHELDPYYRSITFLVKPGGGQIWTERVVSKLAIK
jgi:hypothetical protein